MGNERLSVVEKRTAMGGSDPRHHLVFARDGRNGVPDSDRIKQRHSNNRVPKPDRNSRHRGSRNPVHGSGHSHTASAGLPNWYPYFVIIATFTTITILLIMGMSQ